MSIHGNLSNYMISGKVKVKSNVEIAAIFEDGSAVKNIDRSLLVCLGFFCHRLHLLVSFL